jgi:hypothetical protein
LAKDPALEDVAIAREVLHPERGGVPWCVSPFAGGDVAVNWARERAADSRHTKPTPNGRYARITFFIVLRIDS